MTACMAFNCYIFVFKKTPTRTRVITYYNGTGNRLQTFLWLLLVQLDLVPAVLTEEVETEKEMFRKGEKQESLRSGE